MFTQKYNATTELLSGDTWTSSRDFFFCLAIFEKCLVEERKQTQLVKKFKDNLILTHAGTSSRTWTGMFLRTVDFESTASTNSAKLAWSKKRRQTLYL